MRTSDWLDAVNFFLINKKEQPGSVGVDLIFHKRPWPGLMGGKSGQNDCLTSSAYNRLIAQRATEESHRVQALTESTSSSSASIQVHREA